MVVALENSRRVLPHLNQVGTTQRHTDANQNVVNYYEYDAFGQPLETNQATAQQYRYTGKESDVGFIAANVNNRRVHFPARTYLPFRGAFAQRDPIVRQAGSVYIYASHNPLLRLDPLGLQDYDEPEFSYPPAPPTPSRKGCPSVIGCNVDQPDAQPGRTYKPPSKGNIEDFINDPWFKKWQATKVKSDPACCSNDKNGNPRKESNCFVVTIYDYMKLDNPFGHASFGPDKEHQVGWYRSGWHDDVESLKNRKIWNPRYIQCCCLSDAELKTLQDRYRRSVDAIGKKVKKTKIGVYGMFQVGGTYEYVEEVPDPGPLGGGQPKEYATFGYNCASAAMEMASGLGCDNLPTEITGTDTPGLLADNLIAKGLHCKELK